MASVPLVILGGREGGRVGGREGGREDRVKIVIENPIRDKTSLTMTNATKQRWEGREGGREGRE